ncbi:MAG TPA: hypothetical protein PLA03_13540 [Acidobacteriota bacterium]|nr:hypothetical protein [Acidobacteriota bacterium]
MGRKSCLLAVSVLFVLSMFGIAPKPQKLDNTCLYTVDEIFWGYPDDYLTIRVFNDKVSFDYSKYVNGHDLTAPIMLYNETLNINVDNKLFCFDEKNGVSAVESVMYEKYSYCANAGGDTITPALLYIQKGDNSKKAYLLDPLGSEVHHGIKPKGSALKDCYRGIPNGWRRVVDLVCQVRLAIEKNPVMETDKGGANKETRMISCKFREYYGLGGAGRKQDERGITDGGAAGVVDAKFLSFVYKDKKITGVTFSDIAKILKRRRHILNEASPLIKWDEYNSILSSSDTFPELMKTQYADSFKELEKLVGLIGEKESNLESKP